MKKTYTAHTQAIKALLKKKKVSARELSVKVGVDESYMSRMINGQAPLSLEIGLKVAKALGVTTEKVMGAKVKIDPKDIEMDNLMGSIMMWMAQAASQDKINIDAEQMGRLAMFIYRRTIEQDLTNDEIGELSVNAVKIKGVLLGK